MSDQTGLTRGPVLGFIGVAAVGAVVAVLYLSGVLAPFKVAAPEPSGLAQPEPVEVTKEDPAAETPNQAETAEPEIAAADTPLPPDPPSIDTFRLDPDGRMLVAGRAHPDWETSILLDDAALLVVTQDNGGQFVEFIDVVQSNQPRILSLLMQPADGGDAIASVEQIIIAPSPMVDQLAQVDAPEAQPQTLVDVPETDVTPQTTSSDDTTLATPKAVETAQADIVGEAGTLAPEATQTEQSDASQTQTTEPVAEAAAQTQTVLLADDNGVQVLQAPRSVDAAPEVMSSVALDAITYSDEGQVQLAGRAQGSGFVRVYLDNSPITSSRIEQDGNWRSDLPEIDTGVYTLRIDEVDEEGAVTSRVETPFKREDEALLAQVEGAETKSKITAVTVQPGSTLWAISREAYGDGVLYVRVFEANADRIRNPDLIYPGQVFTIPE